MNPDVASLPLRDIHLPESVSWWPPALGWWIVLGLLIAVIALVFLLRYRKQRKRFSRRVSRELNRIVAQFESDKDTHKLLTELSILLRRVSITAFPDNNPAGMTGEDWLKFLDEVFLRLAAKQSPASFNSSLGKPLITVPYQKHASVSEQDSRQLIAMSKEWVQLVTRRVHSPLASGAQA